MIIEGKMQIYSWKHLVKMAQYIHYMSVRGIFCASGHWRNWRWKPLGCWQRGWRGHALWHGWVCASGEHRLHVTNAALLGYIPHRHLARLPGRVLLPEGGECLCLAENSHFLKDAVLLSQCFDFRFLWWFLRGRRKLPESLNLMGCTSLSSHLTMISKASGIDLSSTPREFLVLLKMWFGFCFKIIWIINFI